jgi:hypothetical protein
MPALSGLFSGEELTESYRDFEKFVREAQTRAMREHRDFVLVWEKDGVALEPDVPSEEDAQAEVAMYAFGEAKMGMERLVALDQKPDPVWPFWKSGACEPVRVSYEGPRGTWVAEFEPMTARGRVISMMPR